jgi:hypothetical protein
MGITLNTQDFLFMQGANGDDPIVRYALVGQDLSQGLFAWIRFGINQQASKAVNPAAYWTENGGVMNPKGPVGGGGGGFPGWGGWPGGSGQGGGKNRKRERVVKQQEEEEDAE